MTSIIKKAIPVTVGLLLLAGSPAFAARYNAHQEKLREVLMVQNAKNYAKNQLILSSSHSANSSPYINDWLEGYPRSADR